MSLTHIQQGSFTSDGEDKILKIRSDIDWIRVINYTASGNAAADSTEFYWQRGMDDGTGVRYYKAGAADALSVTNLADPNGFTLVSNVEQKFSGLQNITGGGITGANPPVVNANAHGFNAGDIVRVYSANGAEQLGGIDFQIGNVNANDFELAYMPAIAAAANADTDGQLRKLYYDPYFYPRRRFATKISQAQQAIVTMSVDHDMKVGQKVRFQVPEEYGMVELDGVTATIVDTGQADADGITNTITIDVNTNSFTAFAFPATGDVPFSPAQVVPYGQDRAESLSQGVSTLNGAVDNQSYIGVNLPGGAASPGGDNNDVMYWIAGRSFSVDN